MAEIKPATDLAELNRPSALAHGLRALDLARGLAAVSPGDQRALFDLAVAKVNLAEVRFGFSQFADAASLYSEVCELGNQLLSKNPGSNLYLRVVSEGNVMLDLSYTLSGNLRTTSRLSTDLDEVIKTTSKSVATISDVRLALDILTQPLLPIPRRPEIAVTLAERAVRQTHRLSPTLLWQLSGAYDSAGNHGRAAVITVEGLQLVSVDRSRLRGRLEQLARPQ